MADNTVQFTTTNSTQEEDVYLRIINIPGFWLTLAVVGFAMSAVIVISNSVLLLVIYKNPCRSFHSPPNILIANLSASEFLLGIFVVYLVALRDLFRYLRVAVPYVGVFKNAIYVVLSATLFVGSSTIVALSMTCFVAINKPMVYKTRITEERMKILIGFIWIAAVLISFLPATELPERIYCLVYLHTHVSLPAILLLFVYIYVFRTLSRRTQEVCRSFKNSSGMQRRQTLARERNMLVAVVTILALFFITYIPQYTTLHLLYFCKSCTDSSTFHQIDIISSRFLFLSSAIDPFIYAWRIKKYRRALKNCWKNLMVIEGSRNISRPTGRTLFARINFTHSNSYFSSPVRSRTLEH